MPFALIHKERRPTQINDRQNATMMLVGDVADRTAILIDDLADTSNTITRAAKLVKKEGASQVYALITHGILSGDAIDRINASALDKVVVTNTVDQTEHKSRCPKLEVLEVGNVFAEVSTFLSGWVVQQLTLSGHSSRAPWREHQRSFRLQLVAEVGRDSFFSFSWPSATSPYQIKRRLTAMKSILKLRGAAVLNDLHRSLFPSVTGKYHTS